jgi:hypothetical protein
MSINPNNWSKKSTTLATWILILVVVAAGIFGIVFIGVNLMGTVSGPGTPTSPDTSTFVIYDYASAEDVSDIVECDLYIPKSDAQFEDANDIYDLNNYKVEEDNVLAKDISIDLTQYEHAWLVISADSQSSYDYFTEDWELLSSTNYPRAFYAYHDPSDMNGNILDLDGGSAWSGSSEGNFTAQVWFDEYNNNELHWAEDSNWYYDQAWSDLTTSTKEKLQNQNNYRSAPTVFDLDDDAADHTASGDYEDITDTTALKFLFNDTIGSEASVTDVNFTISSCPVDYQVEETSISGSNGAIFVVFKNAWKCVNGNFEVDFEIEMGANITLSQAHIGDMTLNYRSLYAGYSFSSVKQFI